MTIQPRSGSFFAAALGAVLGAGLSLLVAWQVLGGRTEPAGEIRELRQQVEELAAELRRHPAPAPAPEVARAEPPAAGERVEAGAIDAEARLRLAAVERQVAELAARRPAASGADPGERAGSCDPAAAAEAQAELTRTQQERILSASVPDADKVRAWGQLRGIKGSWNDAIVATMVQIGLGSADPELRADVWRQASSDQQHPAMVEALMVALQRDADANAREEAAETLARYREQPGVRAALEAAANGDSDADVRAQAARSLASRRR